MKITEAKWVAVGTRWKFVLKGNAEGTKLPAGKDWARHRRANWCVQYYFDGKWFPLHRTGSPVKYSECTLNTAIRNCAGLERHRSAPRLRIVKA